MQFTVIVKLAAANPKYDEPNPTIRSLAFAQNQQMTRFAGFAEAKP
jgi:hypothetical protein